MRTRLSLSGELVPGGVLGLGHFCAGAMLTGTAKWLTSPGVARDAARGLVFVLHLQR